MKTKTKSNQLLKKRSSEEGYRQFAYDALFILLGCALVAFAISSILKPSGLMTGGITGTSIILEKVTGIRYTYFYSLLSLAVLALTFLTLGKYEARKIVLLSVLFPVVLIVFSGLKFNLAQNDLFLASVYYGIIAGLGSGLILKRGYSSGGTDSIAKIINRKLYPFISISQILSMIDIGVILFSALVFDVRIALYAILTQLVFMKAVDVVLYGFESKVVKVEIISEQEEALEAYILNNIGRGITKYAIVGGYTNLNRMKLVTICSPRESMLIRTKVSKLDPMAFVNVLPVISVWGQGVGFESLKIEP